MVIKSKLGTISRGLFFIVVCLILGFLISFVYAQFTFKTKDAVGTLTNRFVINQGATTVNIDILNAQLNMNSNKIINLPDPTALQDAATKNYVDTRVGTVAQVPSGAILLFPPNLTCPAGYTDITSTYNDKVPLTCNGCTGITTGGSTAHTHSIASHNHSGATGSTSISHSHRVANGSWLGALHGTGGHGSGSYYCFGGNDPNGASTLTLAGDAAHTHSISAQALTTGSPSNGYPPFFSVRICQKN